MTSLPTSILWSRGALAAVLLLLSSSSPASPQPMPYMATNSAGPLGWYAAASNNVLPILWGSLVERCWAANSPMPVWTETYPVCTGSLLQTHGMVLAYDFQDGSSGWYWEEPYYDVWGDTSTVWRCGTGHAMMRVESGAWGVGTLDEGTGNFNVDATTAETNLVLPATTNWAPWGKTVYYADRWTNRVALYGDVTVTNQFARFSVPSTDAGSNGTVTVSPVVTRRFWGIVDAKIGTILGAFVATNFVQDIDGWADRLDSWPGEYGDPTGQIAVLSMPALCTFQNIGFATNWATNTYGNTVAGEGYFTREPLRLQPWTLAEATWTGAWTTASLAPMSRGRYYGAPPYILSASLSNVWPFDVEISGEALDISNQMRFATSETVTVNGADVPCTVPWAAISEIAVSNVAVSAALHTGDFFSVAYTALTTYGVSPYNFFGDQPARIYAVDVNERLRAIAAMKDTLVGGRWIGIGHADALGVSTTTVFDAENDAASKWPTPDTNWVENALPEGSWFVTNAVDTNYLYGAEARSTKSLWVNTFTPSNYNVSAHTFVWHKWPVVGVGAEEWDDEGSGLKTNQWAKFDSTYSGLAWITNGTGYVSIAVGDTAIPPSRPSGQAIRGFGFRGDDSTIKAKTILHWGFSYE